MIKVMTVENDEDFVYLIQQIISRQEDMMYVGNCCAKEDSVSLALQEKPDIVLIDLNLSEISREDMSGSEIAKQIRIHTGTKVLILTSYEAPGIVLKASMDAFASGYLYKSNYQKLPQYIRDIILENTAEEIYICSSILKKLTISEYYTLLYYLGYSVEIHSSPKTISNQLSSIVKKVGLDKPGDLNRIFKNYPRLEGLYIS